MHVRWTAGKRFLHLVIRTVGTQEGSRAGMESPQARQSQIENPSYRDEGVMRSETEWLAAAPSCRESRYRASAARTVKPTQWMRRGSLRPAGEVLLENSRK